MSGTDSSVENTRKQDILRASEQGSLSEESTDPLPHNHALAEHLRAIAYYEELYQVKNYEWRAASYITAASLISKLSYELLTAQEARSYRGIGPKISKRVEQFSLTRTSTKLDKLRARDSARDEVISTLSNVVGISVNMANELYEGGVRSLSDLRDNSSHQERVGVGLSPIYLENAQRFLEVIPREEIGLFREQVRVLLASTRWNITITSTGAYRRDEPATSIDLLLTHSSPTELKIRHVMTHLCSLWSQASERTCLPLIKNQLSLSVSHFSGLSFSRRHVTVRLVREESYATALLHTTGPIPFVYDVRVLEQGLGRHLNEYELVTRSGKNITPTTERAIFSSVDMDYVPATRRE